MTILNQNREKNREKSCQLEDHENDKILGKGKFGTVVLKTFRATPLAAEYFGQSSSARIMEKEAFCLRQLWIIANHPILL